MKRKKENEKNVRKMSNDVIVRKRKKNKRNYRQIRNEIKEM